MTNPTNLQIGFHNLRLNLLFLTLSISKTGPFVDEIVVKVFIVGTEKSVGAEVGVDELLFDTVRHHPASCSLLYIYESSRAVIVVVLQIKELCLLWVPFLFVFFQFFIVLVDGVSLLVFGILVDEVSTHAF